MNVIVEDIIRRERAVAIPSVCPGCGAGLDTGGALEVWEYQDQARSAHVNTEEKDLVYDDILPDSGESYITVRVSCVKCRYELASGDELLIHGEENEYGATEEAAELIFKGLIEMKRQQERQQKG